jgi:hypothetical protein
MRAAIFLAASLGLGAVGMFGADQTWNGTISDSKCGAMHPTGEHNGKTMTARQCTQACIKGGAQYVFVADGKVYSISNQDALGLAKYAGENVKLTGEMSGDSVTVKKLAKGS